MGHFKNLSLFRQRRVAFHTRPYLVYIEVDQLSHQTRREGF
jgi:hypothetical protein